MPLVSPLVTIRPPHADANIDARPIWAAMERVLCDVLPENAGAQALTRRG